MATNYGLQIPNRMGIANQFDLPLDYSADDLQARARRAMTQPGWDIEMEAFDPNVPEELQFWDGQRFTATPTDPYKVAGYDPYKGNTLTEEIDINSLPDPFQPFNTYDPGFQTGLDELAAAEQLQANQLNQDYGQFFRNRPVNERNFMSPIHKGIGSFTTNVGQKMGEGWDFAKQLPGMAMSALTGIPFLGQLLGAIGNQFEDRQLTGDIMDEYGNMYSAEELNKMNARGGYYTDPARSARRRTSRIAKMRERLAKDKKVGSHFDKLVAQEKAQQLRDAKNAADRANIQNIQNYTGKELSGYRMSRPPSERGFTGHGRSGMGRDPDDRMARGGRVGYANGGLASLFTRRG
jgi:hypothetical protein